MPDFPPELATRQRQPDQVFDGNELLFRRFKPEFGDDPDVDTIELPDISVCRSKYSRAEHVLCSSDGRFDGWGVLHFRVKDVPRTISYAGYQVCSSRVVHVPQNKNYAHSEVQVFDMSGNQLSRDRISALDKDANLLFRQKILEYSHVCIQPAGSI